jgi:trehalose 6-phosphate phosphatase
VGRLLPTFPANAAFFIDFDGTLAALAEDPALVRVEARAMRLLEALRTRTEGAVAIVTGRPLATLDRMLAPFVLPVAAEHGAVRRDAARRLHAGAEGRVAVEQAVERLQSQADRHSGLLLERKTASVALHYRKRPELEAYCAQAVQAVLADIPGLDLIPGKMVFEIKLPGADKGKAVEAFLQEAPFAGRVPIMIGDDVTDEYAFAAVNRLGGISIKIGEGETVAAYRLATREDFLDLAEAWLKESGWLL